MCGIAGIALKPNWTLPDLRERLAAMSQAMTHRGPDDAGLFVSPDGRAGLVNRRLAIRDLSLAGHMPMCDQEAGIVITYNGEIYNADELRAGLCDAGHTFRSTSDTEVILRGYHAWDDEVWSRLRGMFALAIYAGGPTDDGGSGANQRRRSSGVRRIVLARDPLGIKPLYYAHVAEGIVFASELKALAASGLVSREIDPTSVVAYLMLGSVPNPRTIYCNVHALEPGCALSLDLDTFEVRTRRYWEFPSRVHSVNERDAIEMTRAALHDAVRSHLVSDVPLGAFLSGGLDSSAVVVLMRQVTSGPIRTCSMVFEEAAYSEGKYARAVAEAVGAEHYARVVTGQDVADELERILTAMDQPSIDGVNSYFVSRTAREAGLTVALSGLGGDELFGGYTNTFTGVPRLMRQTHVLQRVPSASALANAAVARLAPHSRYAKVADALNRAPSRASAYLTARGLFTPSEVKSLVAPDIWHAAEFDPVMYIHAKIGDTTLDSRSSSLESRISNFDFVSRAELATYTHNQLLRDTDVMSMAHSLEVRVPLLDTRLVERILSLPDSVKMNGGALKPLLHQAVADLLPPPVRERKEKQGFVFPFARWLRGSLGAQFARYRALPNPWLNPHTVQTIHAGFVRGRVHWSHAWALCVLDAWSQIAL